MKPLVRPLLFAVARLGLFLAVTVWIVGQWWTCVLAATDNAACLNHRGVYWLQVSQASTISPAITPAGHEKHIVNSICGVGQHHFGAKRKLEVGYGFSLCQSFSQSARGLQCVALAFGVCHGMIASIAFAFNIALHIIYRKRLETQPCEN